MTKHFELENFKNKITFSFLVFPLYPHSWEWCVVFALYYPSFQQFRWLLTNNFFFNQKINNKFFHVQNQFCISERTDCTIVVETENLISILDFFFFFSFGNCITSPFVRGKQQRTRIGELLQYARIFVVTSHYLRMWLPGFSFYKCKTLERLWPCSGRSASVSGQYAFLFITLSLTHNFQDWAERKFQVSLKVTIDFVESLRVASQTLEAVNSTSQSMFEFCLLCRKDTAWDSLGSLKFAHYRKVAFLSRSSQL